MNTLHATESDPSPITDMPPGTRALVVESNRIDREALRIQLQSMGLEVFVARDLARARRILQEVPIDLLVLDTLRAEDQQGFECVRSVKAQHRDLVLIVIADQDANDLERHCDALGATAYLIRPVSLRTLRRCIQRAFTSRRQTREIQRLQRELDTANAVSAGANGPRGSTSEPQHRVDDLWFAIVELLLNGARRCA